MRDSELVNGVRVSFRRERIIKEPLKSQPLIDVKTINIPSYSAVCRCLIRPQAVVKASFGSTAYASVVILMLSMAYHQFFTASNIFQVTTIV